MNSWLFRSLVVLYPKAWRERYSKEVGDLSQELLAARETTRLRLALGLTRSALAERVRSLHRGRFITVFSGSTALVVVVVATFLATNGFGFGGATSPRVTRVESGWVRYHDAQLSLPSNETVTVQPGSSASVVRVLELDSPTFTSDSVCMGPPGTMVCLLPLREVPSTYVGEKPTILNGVPAYPGRNGDYYVPSLGVHITASGPLARRIVDTLTRNPMPGCTNPNSWRVCSTGLQTVSGTSEVEVSATSSGSFAFVSLK
jgi:hypothetical protein